ncbi:Mpv17-like protein [Labeo rohita]|uniref:Mpv17-like protein n=1 Tax=Labeo rohita TaxID=84645 RepID=A0ABQ8MTK2_LABRO|nr:Mpv17-like protein [Labeo rohita]
MSLATAVCQCQLTAVFRVHRHNFQRLRTRPGLQQVSVLLNMRKSFFKRAKVLPWISNVTLYGCLFAGGDFVHQCIAQRDEMDWRHTRNVAIVALSFHGNFNYFWLRALEHRFPGRSASMIFRKLLLDQTFASPLATSVFYTGVSFLEGKEDIFADWREKFFNTYKFLNFVLMPLYLRTAFMGCSAFLWATFLCFSRQSGDGTAAVALAWIMAPKKRLLPRSTDEEK